MIIFTLFLFFFPTLPSLTERDVLKYPDMILSLSPLTSELCRVLLRVCSPVPSWPLTTLALPCVLLCTRLPLRLPSLAPAGPVLVTAFCYCSSRGTAPSLLVFPDSAHTFINASLSIPSSVTQSE